MNTDDTQPTTPPYVHKIAQKHMQLHDFNYTENQAAKSIDGTSTAWFVGKNLFVISTTLLAIARRISSWSFAKLFNFSITSRPHWAFLIPRKKFRWVCVQLGLPLQAKALGRIKHGRVVRQLNLKGCQTKSNS